jgi:VCBS repeat-containing protein
MQINVIYDQNVSSLPAGFLAAVNYVVNYFDSLFTNPVTVNIDLGYGEIAGQPLGGGALGESETYLGSFAYSTVTNALKGNEPSASQKAAYATLPAGSPLSGGTDWLATAQEKALGLLSATNSALDGYVGISSTYPFSYSPTATPASNQYYLVGTLEHEFSEVLGRISLLGDGIGGTTSYDIMDLFRFSAPGARQLGTGGPAYFSIDNGSTNLDSWNTNPGGDLGDWAGSAGADANLAFSGSGQLDGFTATDVTLMNVLGWDATPASAIAVVATASEALQGGSPVALLAGAPSIADSASTTLASAKIKIANGSGGAVLGDELFINGQQSGTVGNGAVTVSWNNSTKVLTLTGNASIAAYQALLAAVTYQDGGTDSSTGAHPQRTVTWTVNDGTANLSTTSQIAIDRPPAAANDTGLALVGTTVTVAAAAGVLSNDTDPDSDPLTVTGVSDAAHGAGPVGQSLAGVYGHLTLNADGSYGYVADIAAAINSAPGGSHPLDLFSYTVSDGNGGSGSAQLSLAIDRAPVVTAAVFNRTIAADGSIAVSSLFSARDSDGDTLTQYAFFDATPGSGHFQVGSTVEPSGVFYLTAAQYAQAVFVPGLSGASDHIYAAAYDGFQWSAAKDFYVGAPANTPAVMTASDVQLTKSQTSVAASNLFSASDPDGDTITQYGVYDATPGNGHFQVGSMVEPSGVFYLTAAQYAQAVFIPGASGASEHIYADAYDGFQWSAVKDFYVSAPADTPAVMTASDVQLTQGQTSVAVSNLFTASDPDGDTITQYGVYDATPGNGHFQVGSMVEPSGVFYLTPAQYAQAVFIPGASGASEHIYADAYDGFQWSAVKDFYVTAPSTQQGSSTLAFGAAPPPIGTMTSSSDSGFAAPGLSLLVQHMASLVMAPGAGDPSIATPPPDPMSQHAFLSSPHT